MLNFLSRMYRPCIVRDLFEASARTEMQLQFIACYLLQQATKIFRQTKRAVHFSFLVRMEGSTSCAPRFSSLSEEEKAALIEKVTPHSTKSATKFWVRASL